MYTNEGYPPDDYHKVFLPEQYMDSMRGIAPTLQYFRFHDNSSCIKGAAIGLASFTALKVLDIDIALLFRRIRPVAYVPFAKIIPPSLEILRINTSRDCFHPTHYDYSYEHLLELATNLSTLAPNLRMLIFRDRREWYHDRVGPQWTECDKAFQDQGVEVIDEWCVENEVYCPHHNGYTLLSRWRHSRR